MFHFFSIHNQYRTFSGFIQSKDIASPEYVLCVGLANRYGVIFSVSISSFVTFKSKPKKDCLKFDWHQSGRASTFGTALHLECGRKTHSLDTKNSYVCPANNILRVRPFLFHFLSPFEQRKDIVIPWKLLFGNINNKYQYYRCVSKQLPKIEKKRLENTTKK